MARIITLLVQLSLISVLFLGSGCNQRASSLDVPGSEATRIYYQEMKRISKGFEKYAKRMAEASNTAEEIEASRYGASIYRLMSEEIAQLDTTDVDPELSKFGEMTVVFTSDTAERLERLADIHETLETETNRINAARLQAESTKMQGDIQKELNVINAYEQNLNKILKERYGSD